MNRISYDEAAVTYDATRAASPVLVKIFGQAIKSPNGRTVLDIGGGTGNYALALLKAGFRPLVIDSSVGMLRRAASKVGHDAVVLGDARSLPFVEASFDCAISVNVLHHLPDWPAMMAEARRVVREGPFVLQVYTRENVRANWIIAHYFPKAFERILPEHPTEQELMATFVQAGFRQVRVEHYDHRDELDLSLQALSHRPGALLDETHRLNTSFFRRLPDGEHESGISWRAATTSWAICSA
jgi:SAM-dependent methyltransferase